MLGRKRLARQVAADGSLPVRPPLRVVAATPAEPWRRLGCRRDPWAPAPDPALFFATPAAQKLYMSLLTALRIGSGLFLVTGEAGVGKTMLLRVLENALKAVEEAVTFHSCEGDGADWRNQLAVVTGHAPAILLLDGAELSDVRAVGQLEQLFEQHGEQMRLARLVICGRPEIEQRLQRLVTTALGTKVTFARLRVDRLDPASVGDYVLHRLRQAGFTGAPPLSPETLQRIAERSEGVPRKVNELAANELEAVYRGGEAAAPAAPAAAMAVRRRWLGLGLGAGLAAMAVVAMAAATWLTWPPRERPVMVTAAPLPAVPPVQAEQAPQPPPMPAKETSVVPPPPMPPPPVVIAESKPAAILPAAPSPPVLAQPIETLDLEAENRRIMASILASVAPAAGGDATAPVGSTASPAAPPAATPPPVAAPPVVVAPPVAAVSPAVAPPPVAVVALSAAQAASLVALGDAHMQVGDIAAARLLYERAAVGGDVLAMTTLARTYDPDVLRQWGAVGIAPNAERARYWQRKAAEAGK